MKFKTGLVFLLAGAVLATSGVGGLAAEAKTEKKATEKKAPEKKATEAKKKPEAKKDEATQLVTEGELAKWLVQVLGLSRFVPAAPSELDCFAILLQNNIAPKNGWNSTNVVTVGSLARIVVQAMGKQNEVSNPEKDESWITYLKGSGIEFGTIGEAVDNLGLLDIPIASEAIIVSTDPLKKQHKFRPVDEQQQGADMSTITRIFAQVVTPPPPPMTPN